MNVLTRLLILLFVLSINAVHAADWNEDEWEKTLNNAKGKTIYFHAWGGDENINN